MEQMPDWYEGFCTYQRSIIDDCLQRFDATKADTEALRELETACKSLCETIMDLNRAYYIAVNDIGQDDHMMGFAIRKYTILGYITEAQAQKALLELSDPDVLIRADRYFEVSDKVIKKFYKLRTLDEEFQRLIELRNDISSKEPVDAVLNVLESDIAALRSKLGLHFNWEVVSDEVWYPGGNTE